MVPSGPSRLEEFSLAQIVINLDLLHMSPLPIFATSSSRILSYLLYDIMHSLKARVGLLLCEMN